MARRAGGSRGGRDVPGLAAALTAWYRAFGQHWESQSSLAFADAVERGEAVTVDGEKIWRAMFDRRYPTRWEEFMRDKGLYTVTGDRLTPADD
jgi:hypothetical protein